MQHAKLIKKSEKISNEYIKERWKIENNKGFVIGLDTDSVFSESIIRSNIGTMTFGNMWTILSSKYNITYHQKQERSRRCLYGRRSRGHTRPRPRGSCRDERQRSCLCECFWLIEFPAY